MGQYILQALTGPVKGKAFKVRHGLRIGRSSGGIVLKDPLVSDLHAEIQIYSSGKIMIVDKDSKNKIFIGKKKIIKSVLEEGSRFTIGATEFELKFVKTPEESWSQFLAHSAKNIKDQSLSLKNFSKSVEVKFLYGIQKGQSYYLSYGPRFFGRHSVDCPVFDRKSPGKCFTLIPKGKDVFFVTKHPNIVQLNKQKIEKAKINNGDKISIGDSLLEVKLR